MSNETSAVVVIAGTTAGETKVFHRDFPEIRGEGNSEKEAANQLTNQLTKALDSALTDWRRETINKAVADVQAFADTAS